jgi:hypothetical protein
MATPRYRARFSFDPGSGALLWMDPADWDRWGQPVELELLPISADLLATLEHLVAWYDTSMNWDYPPDPGPWREPECARFNSAVAAALARLRAELGPGWEIDDRTRELHEDPDLDRWLADPPGFRRE